MKAWLEAQSHTSLFLDFDPEAGRKRVFDIHLEYCPQCRGPLTIIAAIEDPRDRQDPHASGLVRAGTAPSTGAAFDRFQLV
jgi:hypothetical protein